MSSSTWRTSSCGRLRSSNCWPPSCATRRKTAFGSSSCCRPRPTTARTTPRVSWAVWCPPTAASDRLLAATLRSLTGTREDPLYVHAKVGIVDDRWLTIGSANLNAHSLLNDTEMNVCTDHRELARRHAAAALGRTPRHRPPRRSRAARSPRSSIELWRPIAAEQLRRREAGRAADAPPARPAGRLTSLAAAARTAAGARRRRLSHMKCAFSAGSESRSSQSECATCHPWLS